jgi:hypothetical protein
MTAQVTHPPNKVLSTQCHISQTLEQALAAYGLMLKFFLELIQLNIDELKPLFPFLFLFLVSEVQLGNL